jgi:hypothetical protein
MKTLTINCSCSDKGKCNTVMRVETDSESPKNLYISIKNEINQFESFMSLTKDQSIELVQYIKSHYKGIE